jgi:hypothetical protein
MIFKLIYLRYYLFLRKYAPSYLGIEDTASSCLLAAIMYTNLLIVYLILSKYIIGSLYYSDAVFYLSFLCWILLCYLYFVPGHRRNTKLFRQLTEEAGRPVYTLSAVFYPIISAILLFWTIKSLL